MQPNESVAFWTLCDVFHFIFYKNDFAIFYAKHPRQRALFILLEVINYNLSGWGNHRVKERKESCILKIPYFQMEKSPLFRFNINIFNIGSRDTFPLRVVSLQRFVFSVSRYPDTVSVYICATLSFILTVQYSDYRLCHCGGIGGGNKQEFFPGKSTLIFLHFFFLLWILSFMREYCPSFRI